MTRRKVLIVDDSEINRQLLCRMLCEDYTLLEAKNGRDALAVLREEGDSLSAVVLDILMPEMDGYEVLRQIHADPKLSPIPVIVASASTQAGAEIQALALGANDYIAKPYNAAIIKHRLHNTIKLRETAAIANLALRDELTGLYNRNAFFTKAGELIAAQPPGHYVMACFDVDNFKVINDRYGSDKGDQVLRLIANTFTDGFTPVGGICCRIMADNFAVLYPRSFMDSDELERIRLGASELDGSIPPITFSIGRYIIDDLSLPVSGMYDRATLAETSIKRRFDADVAIYDESMRTQLLREQEITGEMEGALEGGQFEVWFQPQYNHTSGALIGAEALARWRHPRRGLLSPDEFVPVFEQTGFIYELDKYVWEHTARLLRGWLDAGRTPLPVAVNVSRYDLLRPDMVEGLTALVRRYALPAELLRLEITESAFAKAPEHIIAVVKRLIACGFTVEIDDFGSGYSSLNTLKDVPAHVLKLDMRFLENNENSDRGGNVLESIVRMARWLGMAVIAEGVETREQADYLESIGCSYVQGYLYARPMPLGDYEALAGAVAKEEKMITLETVETLDNSAFWDPKSMDTLIFNSFVGGACIFEYHDSRVELLRANKKYAQTLGGGELTLEQALGLVWHEHLTPDSRATLLAAIRRAIETDDETTCEALFLRLTPSRRRAYFRLHLRVIARTGEHFLFYCTNEDITEQRVAEQNEHELTQQLQAIMDNVGSGITAVILSQEQAHILFANDRYYEILGYTREQYAAAFPQGYGPISPEDRGWVLPRVLLASESGQADVFEYRATHRSGREIWVRQHISNTQFAGVDGIVLLSILDDVTVEKLAEQRHLEADEQLQFLGDASHELLANADTDRAVERVLQRIMEYFGGSRAYIFEFDYRRGVVNNTYEVCGEGVSREIDALQNIPLDTITFWLGAFDQRNYISIEAVEQLDDSRSAERQILEAQGIHSLLAVPLRQDGELLGLLGVDDPGRQQSHIGHLHAIGDYIAAVLVRRDLAARIESDRQALVGLMSDTPGGFARMQVYPDGTVATLYVNDGLCKLLGMTRQEVLRVYGGDAYWGVHPDDMDIVREAVARMLSSGEARSSKYRLMHGEGGYIWLQIFGRASTNAAGEVFLNVYYTDVSEQEKQELSYRAMLPVALAGVMDSSADFSFIKDGQLRYICCSRSLVQALGLASADDLVSKTDYDLFPAKYAESFRAADARLMESGQSLVDFIDEFPALDGSVRYINTSKYLLRDALGNTVGLYGVARDITEYREDYSRLKLLTDSVPGGLATYACSPQGIRAIYFNDTFCRMLGYTREEYERIAAKSAASRVYAEDLPLVLAQLERLLREDVPIECRYRVHSRSGGCKWIDMRGAISERYGDTAIVNAVLYDITERIQAEEQLRLSSEELKLALSQIGKMVFLYDIPTRTLTMPGAYAQKHGLPEVLTDVPQSLAREGYVSAQDSAGFFGFYEAILRGEKNCCAQAHIACADGSWAWESAESITLFDSAGQPLKAVIAVEDITEQHSRAQANEILATLCDSFSAIYLLDAVQSSIIPLTLAAQAGSITHEDAIAWDESAERLITELICPEYWEPVFGLLRQKAVRHGYTALSERREVLYLQSTGRWKRLVVQPLTIQDGLTLRALATISDVTESKRQADRMHAQKLAEEKRAQEYERLLFDSAAEVYVGIIKVDLETGDVYRIDFREGTPVESAMGQKWDAYFRSLLEYIHPDDRQAVYETALEGRLADIPPGSRVRVTYRSTLRSPGYRWYSTTLRATPRAEAAQSAAPDDDAPEIWPGPTATAFTIDINDDMLERGRLKDLSEHDGLTDLFNHVKLEAMLESEYRQLRSCGVLFFDVNFLKQINDTQGHEAGNALLCQVADSIRSITNRRVHGYRYGGDEFVVVVCDARDDELEIQLKLWETRLRALSAGSGVSCSVAVGKAWSRAPLSVTALIDSADKDMYRNKQQMKRDALR